MDKLNGEVCFTDPRSCLCLIILPRLLLLYYVGEFMLIMLLKLSWLKLLLLLRWNVI